MAKMKYKISSRTTILLGRESVSKIDSAIIELVKNAYDADASFCLITFDIENGVIYILDDGTGMTKYIIENYWMLIGTDNKKDEYISSKNRIKSGEKGIGRFALDRIGSYCEMYTKSKDDTKTILWKTDWSIFEQKGKTLDEISADFEYLNIDFQEIIPKKMLIDLKPIINESQITNGTLLKISNLRDLWEEKDIDKIINALGFITPPKEHRDFIICVKKKIDSQCFLIDSEISEEYDYKLSAHFNGDLFKIKLLRNEFDLKKIPHAVFKLEPFNKFPYRRTDFENGEFEFEFTIQELMKTDDKNIIEDVKKIGVFDFNYTFMKMSLGDDSKEIFYYKQISNKRRTWLDINSGIKIYRDNFFVRPYGVVNTNSFDWLGLDARKSKNPTAISHKAESWSVRNKQGYGTVLISRINNSSILDIANREGVVENEVFSAFKEVLINIISVFEKDRAHIGRGMKVYTDIVEEKERIKDEGKEIADEVLNKDKANQYNEAVNKEQTEKLAKAVHFFEEEREELITEIKLFRSLSTNGLITTAIAHDLKSISALLVNRVDGLVIAMNNNRQDSINKQLGDFRVTDTFLKSWISVISNQMKKDKRRRTKRELDKTIKEIVSVFQPILEQKLIEIEIGELERQISKKIFMSDFESIIYNLIINSIEAFERAKVEKRKICINFDYIEEKRKNIFVIHYVDNGIGLSKTFKDPYDIFKFGTTSKYSQNSKDEGTGMGMYIVASTLSEYNAQYLIVNTEKGFALDMMIPL